MYLIDVISIMRHQHHFIAIVTITIVALITLIELPWWVLKVSWCVGGQGRNKHKQDNL